MADIQTAAPAQQGKPRAKKMAFRLDMTPMVDLAFLLLTFFMLTSTFSKSIIMELAMPVKGPGTDTPASKALTLILGKHNQVHYFYGVNETGTAPTLHTTDYSARGLRQVLLDLQHRQNGAVVLIKSEQESTYGNLVDALDEMNITSQKKYALVDLDRNDRALLQRNGL
ncbi:biopolymer transporter ExbD [Hymenobacter aerilatus]|uniref:Biopolymer transporter ExbD n=1 Tax=Hymenobacter aerilatus TaxID=2932251 RepID=A0A8T9STE0_9BACT|nr:biopolymer transporter ExbD [Hymenobacter aerilatus]UOR05007.1 biopolymer transporter ExbD [Hymenobacter aerilatus]